ncbi:hypothetical protein [Leucobacter sp. GX24907]
MTKHTLHLHRSMSIEHRKRAAEWVIIERASLLHQRPRPREEPQPHDRERHQG